MSMNYQDLYLTINKGNLPALREIMQAVDGLVDGDAEQLRRVLLAQLNLCLGMPGGQISGKFKVAPSAA